MLDPITDMKIADKNLPGIIAKAEALEEQLAADPVHIVCCACIPVLPGIIEMGMGKQAELDWFSMC